MAQESAPSDSSLEISWEQIGGQRWSKRAASDPGVHLQGLEPNEMLKELHSEAARAHELKKKQEANLQTTPPRRWRSSGTPPLSRTPGQSWSTVQIAEEDEEEKEVASRSSRRAAPGEAGVVASLRCPSLNPWVLISISGLRIRRPEKATLPEIARSSMCVRCSLHPEYARLRTHTD